MYILGYTWYIHCHGYTMYMPGIYHVYTIHMDDISIWMVYTRYIPGIYQKSGFQMSQPKVSELSEACAARHFHVASKDTD
jgi:hypothetical protein